MCGIAGAIDLSSRRPMPPGCLRAMAGALAHRGPDDEGFLELPGVGLASRRLSIVGLTDGRQPLTSANASSAVVFNGEVFEYPELRVELERRGHRFWTHCDTEVIPHLWEDRQERMFQLLRGQFALALWDARRRCLILARDRLGICPLYWARVNGPEGAWLLFASEIKALLATRLIEPRPDLHGIDQIFTFFALPGPVTCFEGIHSLLPGRYLMIEQGRDGEPARVNQHIYWEMDFPDRGHEEPQRNIQKVLTEFEELFLQAVRRRLRADVPVVSYLSGGVDSTLVATVASRLQGEPIPTFTIQVRERGLDESCRAAATARHVGSQSVVVPCGRADILAAYPRLIRAAEAPVNDTCCAALLLLAREVHQRGFKVALTGEGADEGLAGYPWYKLRRLLGMLDAIPGLPLGQWAERMFLRATAGPTLPWAYVGRTQEAVGGPNAWLDLYGLISLAKLQLYGPRLRPLLGEYVPYEDLELNVRRLKRWHPLNQSLYLGLRIHLPGLLLSLAGDRVAMHSAVETRYPFLDEDVVAFLARQPPSWKLHGFRDKYLLRLLAERWLPREIAWRPKAMFQTPFDVLWRRAAPPLIEQLLSPDVLRETGYFDAEKVHFWREAAPKLRPGSPQRASLEFGLSAVAATQLWHHTFIQDLAKGDADLFKKVRVPFLRDHCQRNQVNASKNETTAHPVRTIRWSATSPREAP